MAVGNNVYKCTAIFDGNGAGWSESYFAYASGIVNARLLFTQLMDDRDDMLGSGFTIPYMRVTQYNVRANTQFFENPVPTNSGFDPDTAWNALLMRLVAAGNNHRSLMLRGWPDDCFKNGRFTPIPSCATALTRFRNTLSAGGYSIVGQDPTKPIKPFVSISGSGLVIFGTPHGYPAGIPVYLYRAKTVANRTIRGTFTTGDSPTATSLQLTGWVEPGGAVSGALREKLVQDSFITNTLVERAALRKVGRPFGLFRGRARRRA